MFPILGRSGSLLVAAAVASNAVLSADAFLPAMSTRGRLQVWKVPLPLGVLDEPNEIPPPKGDGEDSSVADDTLKSLTEKMDKSRSSPPGQDNRAMAFLKKIGRVGGAANKNFVNAVGSDEGSTGRQPAADRKVGANRKAKIAYKECTASGVVDDMKEIFPMTSSGREWRGITDRVMGGRSNGSLRRETDLNGRPANVLTGHVSLDNNGGFLQMVTDLALDPSKNSVDASEYDGIEVDVLYRNVDDSDKIPGTFNIHLRTPGTFQQASYRHTFELEEEDAWEMIRVPFTSFKSHGVISDMPPSVDSSDLRRVGIVAIGREMDVFLAVGGVRFYTVI